MGFLICDPEVEKPDLLKDKFWSEVIPSELPYTIGSEIYKAEEFKRSAEMALNIRNEEKLYSDGSIIYAGLSSLGQPNLKRRTFSKETVYESIWTADSKNTKRGKLVEIILKRNDKKRKTQIQQKRKDPKDDPTRTIASSSTIKLSGADIREANRLPYS